MTYHGKATTQKAAIAIGWARRNVARRFLVVSAQMASAPPARITAAGPLARTPKPRKAPNKTRVKIDARWFGDGSLSAERRVPASLRTAAAAAMARVIEALKSMSGVAARAKPMAATLLEKTMGARRTGCVNPCVGCNGSENFHPSRA